MNGSHSRRRASLALLFSFGGSWFVGLWIVYVLMPAALGVTVQDAYGHLHIPLLWALGEPILIVCLTGVSLALRLWRLAGRATSRRDRPFSLWRTFKSALVLAGWAQVGSIFLWASVGWALGKVAEPSATGPGSWVGVVFASGLFALLAGYAMSLADGITQLNRGMPEHPRATES